MFRTFFLLLLWIINTLSFIDDCTRVSWVYLLECTNDILYVIPLFSEMIEFVKVFHFDNGREFVNQFLANLFQENGILY